MSPVAAGWNQAQEARGGGTGGRRGRGEAEVCDQARRGLAAVGSSQAVPADGQASSSLGRSGREGAWEDSLEGVTALLRTQTHKRHGCWPSNVLLKAAGTESPDRTNPANMRIHASDWSRARWRPIVAASPPARIARVHRKSTLTLCPCRVPRVKFGAYLWKLEPRESCDRGVPGGFAGSFAIPSLHRERMVVGCRAVGFPGTR